MLPIFLAFCQFQNFSNNQKNIFQLLRTFRGNQSKSKIKYDFQSKIFTGYRLLTFSYNKLK
jgi:hypothetical protein